MNENKVNDDWMYSVDDILVQEIHHYLTVLISNALIRGGEAKGEPITRTQAIYLARDKANDVFMKCCLNAEEKDIRTKIINDTFNEAKSIVFDLYEKSCDEEGGKEWLMSKVTEATANYTKSHIATHSPYLNRYDYDAIFRRAYCLVLFGSPTPFPKKKVSPEERLLRAIFGE